MDATKTKEISITAHGREGMAEVQTAAASNSVPVTQPLKPRAFSFGNPRLLLVSDSSRRLQKLQGLVGHLEYQITCTDSVHDLNSVSNSGYEVVALDVAPAQLEPMLKLIRMSDQNSGSLVLVEASQINNHQDLAGVLPLYRAMACSRTEMITLLKRFGENKSRLFHHRGML
jgi:hypothetical protein